MTRNDTLFKILFAIELALTPLVMLAHVFENLPMWSMGLFIGGIFFCRFWLEILKDKTSRTHKIINAIGSVVSISTILIFFMCINLITKPLGIFAVIFVVLQNLMNVLLHNKHISDTIEAVDYCYSIFETMLLAACAVITVNAMLTNISLFTILLTSVISVAYKVYYTIRYTDIIERTKSGFARLFRRK